MRDNTKRNRNIGTAKQGYGQNNKMVIPYPQYHNDLRNHLERLTNYKKDKHIINGHEFIFIVENTLEDYEHACTVEDVLFLLQYLPAEDYGDMKYIIFRQPKRKEVKLNPVWGRLIYFFDFEKDYSPAIILESFPINGKLSWPKKISISARLEYQRLENDGFDFQCKGRYYEALMTNGKSH